MTLSAVRFKSNPRFLTMQSNALPMQLRSPRESGPEVVIIQRAMIDTLHITMPSTTSAKEGIPDGVFGPETDAAVKQFQTLHSLTPDGAIGKNTMNKLDTVFLGDSDEISPGMGGPVPDVWQNAFWRLLDSRTNFAAGPQERSDVSAFQAQSMSVFIQVVKGLQPQGNWNTAVTTLQNNGVIGRLSALQSNVVYERYGKPAPLLTILDTFERFGQDNLPTDPSHPGPGNRHNMDGVQFMWASWTGFADAAIRSGVEATFWKAMRRCILAGFWLDGLRVTSTHPGFPVTSPFGTSPTFAQIHSLVISKPDSVIETLLLDQCRVSLP